MTITRLHGQTPNHWRNYLNPDIRSTRLATPCSRYSMTSGMAAQWAIATEYAAQWANGPIQFGTEAESAIDYTMSLVVNDSPDIAELVYSNWSSIPRSIRQSLGRSRSEVKRMMDR